jgi:hypothetical protein
MSDGVVVDVPAPLLSSSSSRQNAAHADPGVTRRALDEVAKRMAEKKTRHKVLVLMRAMLDVSVRFKCLALAL